MKTVQFYLVFILGFSSVIASAANCTLHLQTNSQIDWNKWNQSQTLTAKGYQVVGEQPASSFFSTPTNEVVAYQNIWVMQDEKSGKVLCSAQIAIFRKTADAVPTLVPVANAVAASNNTTTDKNNPDCSSAFETIFSRIGVCS